MALEIVTRELLMLAVLAAFGCAPAAVLGQRFDLGARMALAPVFGLAIGSGIFTSFAWFWPASATSWLVVVIAIVSVGLATVRYRRREPSAFRDGRLLRRALVAIAQLVLVFAVVTVPTTYLLAHHDSVGPVTYEVYDAGGYVAMTDALQHQSLQSLRALQPPFADVVQHYGEFYGIGVQELDAIPLAANVNELVGMFSTSSQTPFMLVYLLAGAFGAFAAVRYLAGRETLAALFTALLFGGALFLQLIFDGSEGAITGMSMIAPLAILSIELVRSNRRTDAVLVGLLVAGLIGLYPLFVPEVVLAAAVVVVVLAIQHRRTVRAFLRGVIVSAVPQLVIAVVVAAAVNPVALVRAIHYWLNANGFLNDGLPGYDLPTWVVPSWLLQTRDFYSFATTPGLVLRLSFSIVVALLMLVLIVRGVARYPLVTLPFIALIVACGTAAGWVRSSNSCTYCEDRSLLPLGPVLAVLLGVGLVAVVGRRGVLRLASAIALGLGALAIVGRSADTELRQFQSSFFLTSGVRDAVATIPRSSTVQLEGFNEGPGAPGEQFLTYELVDEQDWLHVSFPEDYNDHEALAYMSIVPLRGPQFRPGAGLILTRLAGTDTGRTVLDRGGEVAVEKTPPLDLLLDYGVAVAPLGESSGIGNVDGPMQFILTGGASGAIHVVLSLHTAAGSTTVAVVGHHGFASTKSTFAACLGVQRTSGVQTLDVQIAPANATVALLGFQAKAGPCP